MDTMDYGQEIEALERQLADTDQRALARADVEVQLATFRRAQEAEHEARRREAETKAAAQGLRDAEAEARRAEAAPLRAELAEAERPLAEIEQEITRYIWKALADGHGFHARYVQTLTQRNAVASGLNALGDHEPLTQVLAFEAFVLTRLRRFNGAGRTASGAAWAREED